MRQKLNKSQALEILGLPINATDEDIKKTYRKLAKKHHPDKNSDNPNATDRFVAIQNAYDVLKKHAQRNDPKARQRSEENFTRFKEDAEDLINSFKNLHCLCQNLKRVSKDAKKQYRDHKYPKRKNTIIGSLLNTFNIASYSYEQREAEKVLHYIKGKKYDFNTHTGYQVHPSNAYHNFRLIMGLTQELVILKGLLDKNDPNSIIDYPKMFRNLHDLRETIEKQHNCINNALDVLKGNKSKLNYTPSFT